MRVNDSSLNYVGFYQARKSCTGAAFSEYGQFETVNLQENEQIIGLYGVKGKLNKISSLGFIVRNS